MANDNFYGYKRNPNKTKGKYGVDMDFESINPYEFKKGMNCEFADLGTTLREADHDLRIKTTEKVLKKLKENSAYYSYKEHYDTVTRNIQGRKPSFKTFMKEVDGHSMKEVGEKFDNDKMKEIKLRESIKIILRGKLNERVHDYASPLGLRILDLLKSYSLSNEGIPHNSLDDLSDDILDLIDRLGELQN